MAQRAGTANLPLNDGQVPKWLADRMTRLGAVISEAIVHHYGRDELLRRLAHPFWFQSFGAVMGMDWHSSGIATSAIGALKRGLAPIGKELGIDEETAHARASTYEDPTEDPVSTTRIICLSGRDQSHWREDGGSAGQVNKARLGALGVTGAMHAKIEVAD